MTTVTLRFFAAARAAAGTSERTVSDEGPLTIAGAIGLAHAGAADYDEVTSRCSFLVNGIATTDREKLLTDGDTVDVLPPFAGG